MPRNRCIQTLKTEDLVCGDLQLMLEDKVYPDLQQMPKMCLVMIPEMRCVQTYDESQRQIVFRLLMNAEMRCVQTCDERRELQSKTQYNVLKDMLLAPPCSLLGMRKVEVAPPKPFVKFDP